MIISESYSIPTGKYVRILFGDILNNYLAWIIIILLALILFTIIDIRWFFVLLMAIFVVTPMLVSYLYIWHCFKPETRLSLLSKYLEISALGIKLIFDDDKQLDLDWRVFSKCRKNKEFYIFTFKKSKYLYFIIPIGVVLNLETLIPNEIVFQED